MALRYIELWDGETMFDEKNFPAYTSISGFYWISFFSHGIHSL